ncbi:MAG TPA: efflux RND transporter permease subunit, partial [Spirochaetota bacterium]|nr:efflux RND transporter permease subunit [Spirochaetota bacterium]
LEVRLPDEVRDEPRIRQFKTGQKAVLDIAVINTNCELLNNRNRYHLQQLGLSLENQLTSLAEVSSISRSGYLKKEMQVNLDPDKLRIYNIPVSTVLNKINSHNIRQPVGSLEDRKESRVTLSASLYNKKELNNLIIQGAFTGQPVRLKQIAAITNAFAKNTSIIKVNGYEAIIFRVTKSGSSGILKAMAKIRQTVNSFRQNSLKNSPVQIVLLDDESRDIRNRLSIITVNGMIGFVLILIMLFIFLDFRSGVWVAMGIPFCFAFTLTIASMMGYTINNITLAAVIIVMGMIVDDAIVVAENITRLRAAGIPFKEAALKGTVQMLLPITASIVTTCIAFIPLLLMSGRWSRMNSFIPPIIFLMLGASLFESVLILPGHMNLSVPRKLQVIFSLGLLPLIEKYYPAQNIKKNNIAEKNTNAEKKHWFMKIEKRYGKIIEWTLHHRKTVFMVFIMLLITAAFIFISKMKFEMFPREESTQVSLSATAPAGTTRLQTAAMALKLEQILKPDLGKNLVGFRTRIARGRRGRAAEENRLSMRIELVPRGKRNKPLKELLQIWEKKMKKIPDFTEVRFMKHWWGSDSGSPIELVILDNNDQTRGKAVQKMFAIMSRDPALINTEIERELTSPEYTLKINHDKLVKLSINPGAVGATLRTILDGRVLYEIPSGDEETDLKVTVQKSAKNRIDKILNLPVENRSSYMVPLKNIVSIKKGETRASISRENFKRTTKIYADLRARMPENPPAGKGSKFGKKNSKNKPEPKASAQLKPTRETKPAPNEELVDKTPLEIAAYYESKIFPKVMSIYPTTTMYFSGEIKDSRESQSEFIF